ncbi:hypothetical protein G3M48_003282 [Beauveria asiatica]|uniref:Uncharacterized protein n=1 Tax=Beauveria asiatica TaxID=1069075 RepID=A0AAW0RWU7_9HYPO
MNFNPNFHEQPVGNWPMEPAQSMHSNAMSMGQMQSGMVPMEQMQSGMMTTGQMQSGMVPMSQAQSMQLDAMSIQQRQAQSIQFDAMSIEQRHFCLMNMEQMQGQAQNSNRSQNIDFTAQVTSTQTSSLQYSSQQYQGIQTTHMRADQQQSRHRSTRQIAQGGRNSGPDKQSQPRTRAEIDASIMRLRAEGKLHEGNRAALIELSHKAVALQQELDQFLQREKLERYRGNEEPARQSRRQSRKTVDHVESSRTQRRRRRTAAAAAAAANKTSPELLSGESRHELTFSPGPDTDRTSPITPLGASGNDFTISPARGAVCINPSALATTTTITAEPVQQQSSTNGGTLLPGAAASNASAAAVPETVSTPQQAPTSSLMLPPGAVFINSSSPATTTATAPSAAVAAEASADAIENAADHLALAPILQFLNSTENTDEQARLPEATDAAKEEPLPPMDWNADLFGDENLSPMDWNADLFGNEHLSPPMDSNAGLFGNEHLSPPMDSNAGLFGNEPVPPMDQDDELGGTEEYIHGQDLSEMLEEAIERRQAEAETEDCEMW